MKLIGITGSYASGKSFVLAHLARLGYKVFSADEYVNLLYLDPKIQQQVIETLPGLTTFDRKLIARVIYKDEDARISLQKLIHPLVIQGMSKFKEKYKKEELLFVEMPLLFESSLEDYFDFIVTTFCSENSRLERATMRANFDRKVYDRINQIQLPQKEKVGKSDSSVNTDVSLLELETRINQLLELLKGKQKWN